MDRGLVFLRLQIWSLHTYASVDAFAVDPLATSLAFSRDGSFVITGGAKVNVYAVSNGSLLYQLGDRRVTPSRPLPRAWSCQETTSLARPGLERNRR